MPRVTPDPQPKPSLSLRLLIAGIGLVVIVLIGIWVVSRSQSAADDKAYQAALEQGQALEHDQKFTEAATAYQNYLHIARSSAHRRAMYLQLAGAEGQAQRYQDAITAYTDAAKLPPGEDDSIVIGLANSYDLAGDKKQAIAYYNRAITALKQRSEPGIDSRMQAFQQRVKELQQ